MLLTAGLGERMRPLTERLPKPAIPVLGRPIAMQLVSWLGRAGVERVVCNTHHLPGVLRETLGDGSDFGPARIDYSHEESLLGTGGGLRQARPLLAGSGTLVVSNGDSLSDIDLPAALAAHRASGLAATLVLAPHRPGYSEVQVDRRDRVISLAGHPPADPQEVAASYLFSGTHLIEEQLLDRIPPDGSSDIVRHVYRALAAERQLGCYVHRGFWWEFGSPSLYYEGSLVLLERSFEQHRRITEHDPVRRLDQSIVAIGAGAKCSPRAQIRGRVALGLASRIGEEAVIEDTLVMPEAWVGPSCRLRRAVVGPGTELPAGFEADDALICVDSRPEADYGPSVTRVGGLLVCPIGAPAPR